MDYKHFYFFNTYVFIYQIFRDIIPCFLKIIFSIATFILFKKALSKKFKSKNKNEINDDVDHAEWQATTAVIIISFVSILYHIPITMSVFDNYIKHFLSNDSSLYLLITEEISVPSCLLIITLLNLIDKNFRNEIQHLLND